MALAKQVLEARRLRFHMDGIRGGHLCGWVYCRDDAKRHLSILVENRAGIAVEHAADLYRADVHRAAAGSDGYCGFAVPLHALSDEVVIACKRPYRVIFRGPLKHASSPPVGAVVPKGDRLFRMDGNRQLSGWLSSLTEPDERLQIRLRVDGQIAGVQTACLYRGDQPSGARDGYHGFAFAYPAAGRKVELIDGASGQCLHHYRARA